MALSKNGGAAAAAKHLAASILGPRRHLLEASKNSQSCKASPSAHPPQSQTSPLFARQAAGAFLAVLQSWSRGTPNARKASSWRRRAISSVGRGGAGRTAAASAVGAASSRVPQASTKEPSSSKSLKAPAGAAFLGRGPSGFDADGQSQAKRLWSCARPASPAAVRNILEVTAAALKDVPSACFKTSSLTIDCGIASKVVPGSSSRPEP